MKTSFPILMFALFLLNSHGERPIPLIIGADVSWLPEYEAKGESFADSGIQKDLLVLLKNRHFNWIRLRLFHNPLADSGYSLGTANPQEPFCGLEYTLNMAKRVKEAGLNLLLDFHYSDTWADPAHQRTPAAWEGLNLEQLKDSVYQYTSNVLEIFRANQVLPQMVQVGNEINAGMLFPIGENIENQIKLVDAGLKAVHDVDSNIYTMVHSASGGDNAVSQWFFGNITKATQKIDVLGLSCYTEWHGPPEDWRANLNQLAEQFPSHDFMITEYSYEKEAVLNMTYDFPGNRVWGSFIWEPVTWMEYMFDWEDYVFHANSYLDIYSDFAESHNLVLSIGKITTGAPFKPSPNSLRVFLDASAINTGQSKLSSKVYWNSHEKLYGVSGKTIYLSQ